MTSLPEQLGEIGGLNEGLTTIFMLILSSFQANSFLVDSIKRMFLVGKTVKINETIQRYENDLSLF